MSDIWENFDGTWTSELSTLEANNQVNGSIITLPNGDTVHISDCQKDMNSDGETIGWNCTINGIKYLIIND